MATLHDQEPMMCQAVQQANTIAGRNGIGLCQALENRILGTKSRGVQLEALRV